MIKEIVQALRCTSTPGDHTSNCEQCPYWKKEQLNGRLKEKLGTDTWTSCDVDKVGTDAANLIERLTAENADLGKEIEWKDMVIALAQREQAKAEAERDALLGELRKSGCTYCKYETVCEDNPWLFIRKVCDHCGKRESCVCQTCTGDGSETDKWQWRGLPEAPEVE